MNEKDGMATQGRLVSYGNLQVSVMDGILSCKCCSTQKKILDRKSLDIIMFLLNNAWILKDEVTCSSLLEVKELQFFAYQLLQDATTL